MHRETICQWVKKRRQKKRRPKKRRQKEKRRYEKQEAKEKQTTRGDLRDRVMERGIKGLKSKEKTKWKYSGNLI